MLSKRLGNVIRNLNSVTIGDLLPRLAILFLGTSLLSEIKDYLFQRFRDDHGVIVIIYYTLLFSYFIWVVNWIWQKFGNNVLTSPSSFLNSFSEFCFSKKNNKEVFTPLVADWQEEYFEALFKKENWKARWINVRYTYAFLTAMWQKSPIGDLIEFVVKIAKQ